VASSAYETQSSTTIALPAPADNSSLSVFAVLAQRRTTREFSAKPLSKQLLSNLLWAAFGVNRGTGPFGLPGRTAASASNSQEIDIYAALEEGTYLYDAFEHVLALIVEADLRHGAMTPGQRAVNVLAPVQLINVADVHRLTHTAGFQEPRLQDPEGQKAYYHVDTGLIAGNVYLFAAAQGLAAWFHNCEKTDLAMRLGLRPEQHVLFAQSVGYPQIPTG
jgi:nitroreductase